MDIHGIYNDTIGFVITLLQGGVCLVTLKQIAEELGVSVSMVSRVLTNKDRVDPEKRRLIKAALKKYNYVPNEMARGLRGISSRSFGIIVPTFSSNYYTRIITAAQKAAQENYYTVITCCSHGDPEREREAVELLRNKQVDKVMCAPISRDADTLYADAFGADSVVIFDYDTEPARVLGNITFNAYSDAYRLAKFAVEKGHTRFLILNHLTNTNRSDGFTTALADSGISASQIKTVSGLGIKEDAVSVCRQVFSSDDRPTCVLATSDYLAYSTVKAARMCGLSVPDELSVACFDACDETGILTPEFTCIMQPAEKIGELAARMLMDGEFRHITVEADFIKGNSCVGPKQTIL